MEENKSSKKGLIICIIIICALIIALAVVYYLGFVKKDNQNVGENDEKVEMQTEKNSDEDNKTEIVEEEKENKDEEEKDNKDEEEKDNKNEEKKEETIEELDIDDELVEELYSYVPKVIDGQFLKTAYQSKKVTFNDLPNKVKLANVFSKIDFRKEDIEFLDAEEDDPRIKSWRNSSKEDCSLPEAFFEFSEEIINKKVKEFYGKEAVVKNESFAFGRGQDCSYENGIYTCSFGGDGLRCIEISNITKAEKEEDTVYIYDKFLVVEEVEVINNFVGDEYNVYNSTDSDPMDEIVDEKLASLYGEEFEDKILEKYEDEMKAYKHTFKKNSNGEFYWVSTEPIK